MKLLSYALPIVIASALCMQSISTMQQPVRASKKGTKPITVAITGEDGREISKTSFKQNTDRFASKLRGKSGSLWFDWAKGVNTITAYYDDKKDKGFGKEVSKEEAPAGSEIVIHDTGIEIKSSGKQKMQQEKNTTPVKVKIEADGDWHIMTGSSRTIKDMSLSANKSTCDSKPCTISLDNFRPYVYARKKGDKRGNEITFTMEQIQNTNDPILLINKKGKVKIISSEDYAESMLPQPKTIITTQEMLDTYKNVKDSEAAKVLKRTLLNVLVQTTQDALNQDTMTIIDNYIATYTEKDNTEAVKFLKYFKHIYYDRDVLAMYKKVLNDLKKGIEKYEKTALSEKRAEEACPLRALDMTTFYSQIASRPSRALLLKLTQKVYASINTPDEELNKEIQTHLQSSQDPNFRSFLEKLDLLSNQKLKKNCESTLKQLLVDLRRML